jgi:hypothetical protein
MIRQRTIFDNLVIAKGIPQDGIFAKMTKFSGLELSQAFFA